MALSPPLQLPPLGLFCGASQDLPLSAFSAVPCPQATDVNLTGVSTVPGLSISWSGWLRSGAARYLQDAPPSEIHGAYRTSVVGEAAPDRLRMETTHSGDRWHVKNLGNGKLFSRWPENDFESERTFSRGIEKDGTRELVNGSLAVVPGEDDSLNYVWFLGKPGACRGPAVPQSTRTLITKIALAVLYQKFDAEWEGDQSALRAQIVLSPDLTLSDALEIFERLSPRYCRTALAAALDSIEAGSLSLILPKMTQFADKFDDSEESDHSMSREHALRRAAASVHAGMDAEPIVGLTERDAVAAEKRLRPLVVAGLVPYDDAYLALLTQCDFSSPEGSAALRQACRDIVRIAPSDLRLRVLSQVVSKRHDGGLSSPEVINYLGRSILHPQVSANGAHYISRLVNVLPPADRDYFWEGVLPAYENNENWIGEAYSAGPEMLRASLPPSRPDLLSRYARLRFELYRANPGEVEMVGLTTFASEAFFDGETFAPVLELFLASFSDIGSERTEQMAKLYTFFLDACSLEDAPALLAIAHRYFDALWTSEGPARKALTEALVHTYARLADAGFWDGLLAADSELLATVKARAGFDDRTMDQLRELALDPKGRAIASRDRWKTFLVYLSSLTPERAIILKSLLETGGKARNTFSALAALNVVPASRQASIDAELAAAIPTWPGSPKPPQPGRAHRARTFIYDRLTASMKEKLRVDANSPEDWEKDTKLVAHLIQSGTFDLLLRASLFVSPGGLASLRLLLNEWSLSGVSPDGRIRYPERYDYLADIGFPEELATLWSKPYEGPIDATMGTRHTAESIAVEQALSQIGSHRGEVLAEGAMAGLIDQVDDLRSHLKDASPNPLEKAEALARRFEREYREIRRVLGDEFANIRTDLRNLVQALRNPGHVIVKGTLNVTGDPEDMARSGSAPVETCQRLTELWSITSNGEGQPLNRMLYGQFKMANVVSDGSVVARRLIELTIDDDGPALLIHPLYSDGRFAAAEALKIQMYIYANRIGIPPYRVFFSEKADGGYPRPLHTDVPIYRDSFR